MANGDSLELPIPSGRDIRATLDTPDATACVVACPPHPQFGGRRTDARLRAVSDAVHCACLRFDYGAWDEGYGELADVRTALAWARDVGPDDDGYERVALFGYSFGGCLAVLAAARESADGAAPAAVSALAPAAHLGDDLDATAELEDVTCPVQVVYGERDDTADWKPLITRARALDCEVEAFPADHHFVGQAGKVAERVAAFLSSV